MTEEVLFEAKDGIAKVTLNRPSDENRMTPEVLQRLSEIIDLLGNDAKTQAVIFTGAGREFFSAGMLHPKVRAKLSSDQILGIVRLGNEVFDGIEALPQITIAALNGVTLRATCASQRRTPPGRCRKRSGAAFPAPAPRCACR